VIEVSGKLICKLRVHYTGDRPPEEQAYLDSIDESKWYPLEEFLPIYRAYTRRDPEAARWQMKAFAYLFRDELRADGVCTPEQALDRLGDLYGRTTRGDPSFGYRTLERESGRRVLEKSTWGDCYAALGTFEGMVKCFGGQHIAIDHVCCKERGDERCIFDVRWKDADHAQARELPAHREHVSGQVEASRAAVSGLIRVLRLIAAGDFQVEAESEHDDALGMLAVGLNVMVDDMRELVETEKRLRAELAAKVAALETANKALCNAQRELVQTERLASLGQLVAGLAHELNNPIAIVYASTRLLDSKLDQLEPTGGEGASILPDVHKLAQNACEAAQRSRAIIDDLRQFSRLGEADLKTVDIHKGIESALNLLSFREGEGIRFHRQFGAPPSIECYPSQLNQAFMCLLQNACEAVATRRGPGNVWISTQLCAARELVDWPSEHEDEEVVVVSIRDDGLGIPPEGLDRIFDPFYTTKQVGQGTGLGLSIAYGIAQRHRGRIRVVSDCERGTTVAFEFPLFRRTAEGS
jgi:signal transduction histidine kinase